MPKRYSRKILRPTKDRVGNPYRIGIKGKQTLKDFNPEVLTPIDVMNPEDIRELRDREQLSQTVFARVLNVSASVVSQWERGEKHPSGSSLKLLCLAKHKGLEAIR